MAKFAAAALSGTRAGAIGATCCHGTVPLVCEACGGLTSSMPVALGGTIKLVAEADICFRHLGACTWAQFGGTQGSDPSELLCRQDL